MWKNKHVVAALLIAPILALISYFAVDRMVSEQPHAAKPGSEYVLVEKPNCRYQSGRCQLKNGDFEVTLTAQSLDAEKSRLQLDSKVALKGVRIALLKPNKDQNATEQYVEVTVPLSMTTADQSGYRWSLDLPHITQQDRLRLVAAAQESLYYGESATRFIDYQTSFGKDLRSKQQ